MDKSSKADLLILQMFSESLDQLHFEWYKSYIKRSASH